MFQVENPELFVFLMNIFTTSLSCIERIMDGVSLVSELNWATSRINTTSEVIGAKC